MNLFWQITTIEFLLNVAVFTGAIIFYGPVRLLAEHVSRRREFAKSLLTGLLFGIATSAALLLPVHLEGGALVGCDTILLTLAGALDGAVAILAGLASSVVLSLLPWGTYDQSRPSRILSLLVAAAVGFVFQYWLARRRFPHHKQLQYVDLPVLGVLLAIGSLSVFGSYAGAPAVISSIIPAIGSNMFAVFIVGTLLLHEKRRSEAESELRKSEAHLAGQAKELAVARDTADAANRAKLMFIANMSHELRTPLNAILGYAQLLKRDQNLTKWQADASNTIQESGEHLLVLITDILDISKIEAGKVALQLSSVDIIGFLHGIANIIRIKAEEKALVFACDIPSDVPAVVKADKNHLRQVLLNLLSNAVKFTDVGRVDLRVKVLSNSEEQAQLRFEVKDTGIGIAEEQLETVFRPFEQVGDERHRAGGTGLGLSISSRLVRLMGSEIRVESTPGQGSCFWFDMTAAKVGSEQSVPPISGHVSGYKGSRKRILVVDDTDANRSVLTDTLRSVGFEVSQAVNGLEAVQYSEAAPPDLILMDIRMPVLDGLEATRRMQQIPNLCKIPIIAVSAGVTQEKQAVSMSAGAKAFLTKPIDNACMFLEIGRLLDLTWICEGSHPGTVSVDDPDQRFVVPQPAQMESLRALAKAGNMRAIREQSERLAALDPQYRPFADRITQLAQGYQSKAVLRLVEQHAEQNQVEQKAQS